MKYNYPIRYAAMPIIDRVGWIHGANELERDYDIVGYVASKCYLLGIRTIYFKDGSQKKEFEVVFPYKKESYRNNNQWERIAPEYNYYNQATNSIIVSDIFYDFEKVKDKCDELNKNIFEKYICSVTYSEHQEKMNVFYLLENKIEQLTSDMIINNQIKQQSIIIMGQAKDKILSMTLYDFIDLYRSIPFYVCNVTEEEYENMKIQINNNGVLNERNARNTNCGYNKFNYLLANDTKNNTLFLSNYNASEKIGSYFINQKNELNYDNQMYQFSKLPIQGNYIQGIKVYTTESYEDVINEYRAYENIIIDNKVKTKP